MPRLNHPRTALSGFADARLPPWRRVLVARHLLRCTSCAVQVAQIRALRDVLRDSCAPEVPPHLLDRLLALGGEAGPRDGVPAWPAPGASPVVPPHLPVVVPRAGEAPAGVGAAGVLVASVLVLGAVVAGSTATGVPLPWPSASSRASVGSVLPRLWPGGPEVPATSPGDDAPGGAAPVRPVDNGPRP